MAVYDVLGRQVRMFYAGTMEARQAKALVFEADNLPSGLHLIRATGEQFAATRTLTLMK